MMIKSHNIQASTKSRIQTPPLVIIEFALGELPEVGTPGQLLFLSLSQNYINKKKDLHHEFIRFDLKNEEAIKEHVKMVSARVKALKEMCVFPLFL